MDLTAGCRTKQLVPLSFVLRQRPFADEMQVSNSGGNQIGRPTHPTILRCANFLPEACANIQFIDKVICPAGRTTSSNLNICAPAPTSSMGASGSDGRSLGANINNIFMAMAGVAP
jgi:hypothetical protein